MYGFFFFINRMMAFLLLSVEKRNGDASISPPAWDVFDGKNRIDDGQDAIKISRHSPTSNISMNISGKYFTRFSASINDSSGRNIQFGRRAIITR